MYAHTTVTLLLTLALSAPAAAMDLGGTVQIELGSIRNTDRAWDFFSDANAMPTRGLRAGVRLGEHINVLGGWHHINRGQDIHSSEEYDYYDYGSTGSSSDLGTFRAAYTGSNYSLTGQFGVPIAEVAFPYVAVDGLLLQGKMRLDEDSDTKKNLGQISHSGANLGVAPMGGMEFRSPSAALGIQVGFYGEVGWAWYLSSDFGDFGEMQPGGLVFRGGAGLRF